MIETWYDLATQARRSASHALLDGQPRTCLSRAYYTAYSKVTHALAAAPNVAFPTGREGPSHPGKTGTRGIRRMIETSMPNLTQAGRVKLSEMIGRLYTLRLDADYRPSVIVDDADAHEAMAILKKVFDAF